MASLVEQAFTAVGPQVQQVIAGGIEAGLKDYRKYMVGGALVVGGFMVATLLMLRRTMKAAQRCGR